MYFIKVLKYYIDAATIYCSLFHLNTVLNLLNTHIYTVNILQESHNIFNDIERNGLKSKIEPRGVITMLLLGYSLSAPFWYVRNITPGGSDTKVVGTNKKQKQSAYASEITKNTLKTIYYWQYYPT